MQVWKMTGDHTNGGMQDWKMKMTDEVARVANNGVENDGRDRRRGKCKTGKRGTENEGLEFAEL